MKKSISLLLAAVLLGGIYPQVTFGFTNPLANYDLYEDTRGSSEARDNVMSEVYYKKGAEKSEQQKSISDNKPPKAVPTTKEGGIETNVQVSLPQRRNVYLRNSSRRVFGQGSGNWTKGPYFYEEPTLESIKEKYRKSNFAGCMQECEAYVQSHPNDTIGYYYLAMSYAKCGQKEDAILAYEKVISLHDSPLIVKYATNGRNCVMENEDEAKCFQDVNIPDLYYPYREMAQEIGGLTPVNAQDLIERNYTQLTEKYGAMQQSSEKGEDGENKGGLPFGDQDEKLDRFIRAPYGSGLSPELEREIKLQQLKNIQNDINNEGENNPGKYYQNIRNIKEFDSKKKSEAEQPLKLAWANNMDEADIFNNPEYIQNKKELDEIKMMFGNYDSSNSVSDISTVLPQLSENGKNISPEVIQMMMMQTVMPNIIDTNSGF